MTKKDLRELYFLKKKIKRYEEKISTLESIVERTTSDFSQRVQGGQKRNNVDELIYLKSTFTKLERKAILKQFELEKYFASIENQKLSLIFCYRFIDCLSWVQIGHRVNMSSDGARMAVDRFLKGNEDK